MAGLAARRAVPVRHARWIAAAAILALIVGMYTGLARGGVEHRYVPAEFHAILMVLGFVGTFIGLDRAALLARRWGWLAPAISGVAVVALLVHPAVGAAVFLAAGLAVGATGVAAARVSAHAAPLAVTAVAWVMATAAWWSGAGSIRITPLLSATLVPALVTWHLEEHHPPRRRRRRDDLLCVALLVLVTGAAAAVLDRSFGLVVVGSSLIAVAVLLPVAGSAGRLQRVTRVATRGWMLVAGVLWFALGVGMQGALLHDAAVHALFLGAVMPAVALQVASLRARLARPCRLGLPALSAMALLHVSVALRVGTDLASSHTGREFALHGNSAALVLLALAVWLGCRRHPDAEVTA